MKLQAILSSYLTYYKYGYSRFKVYANNDYEINIIEWDVGSKSPIIRNNNSVIKLIKGSLIENRYTTDLKPITRNCIVPIHSFNVSKTHSYYINNFHSIQNINKDKSYSLHFFPLQNMIYNN